MKKQKFWLLGIVLALALAMSVCLVACGEEKVAVSWDYNADQVEISVTGEKGLPTDFVKGAEMQFTVTPKTGYEVTSVKAGSSTVRAQNGVYKTTIKDETKITVVAQEKVKSVNVKTNPTKLTYTAGEALDKAGMVVEVEYETNRREDVTNYTIVYNDGSTFLAGDTSFAVRYNGINSDPVNLTETVKGIITIDPASGTIAEGALNALQARVITEGGAATQDLLSYTVEQDTGVITLEYTALKSDITLPTDVSKVGPEWKFLGWSTVVEEGSTDKAVSYTKIESAFKNNIDLEASWQLSIVTINELSFETVAADDSRVSDNFLAGPYLVLNVDFIVDADAQLYLYEGNDEVELKGDVYNKVGDGVGQDLYFYLPTLGNYSNGSYSGKWMDVCFQATIDGRTYTQVFELDHEDPVAEVGTSVNDGKNSYTLLTYNSASKDWIKLAFKAWDFNYSLATDGDTLTISGVINTSKINDYATKTDVKASVSIAGVEGIGSVDADGNYSMTFDMSKFAVAGQTTMPSLTVTAAGEGETRDTIMTASWSYTGCNTATEYSGNRFSNPSYYSNAYESSTGYTLYFGPMGSDWQNAFYSVVDTAHAITRDSVALRMSEDDKPLMVISGTYGSAYTTEDKVVEAVLGGFDLSGNDGLSLQQYPSWPYRWYGVAPAAATEETAAVAGNLTVVVDLETNTYELLCDLSTTRAGAATEFADGDFLYGHVGNSNMSIPYIESSITWNGLTFTFGPANSSWDSWLSGLSIIYVTAAEA